MFASRIVEAINVFKDSQFSLAACVPSLSPDQFSLALHGKLLRSNR
jgi:hypothetical protein